MNPFHSSSKSDSEEKTEDATTDDQQQKQQRREPEPQRYAHIVSGYNAFDETQNATKPALGARIVAINQVAVPETFTLAELLDSLKANSDNAMLDDDSYSDDHEYETYTVTFRNDPLTAAQRQALHLPPLPLDDDDSSSNDDGPTPAITPCGSSDREDAAAVTTTTTSKKKKQQPPSSGGGGGGFHFGFIRLGAAGENSNHNSLANRARTWSSSSQKSVPKEPASLPEETACTSSTAKSGGNTAGGGDTTETTKKDDDDVTTAATPAAATTATTKETTANAEAAATGAVAAEEEQQQSSSSSSSLRPGDITRTAKDVLQFWKPSAAARQQQQDESASQ